MAGCLALGLLGLVAVEGHDPACAACHLPPETQFVARARGPAVDLASAHARPASGEPLRCVDCHGGPGLAGRARSLAIGAADLATWLRGDYTVLGTEYLPAAVQRHPLPDATCRACHEATLARPGFENHYHRLWDEPERPADLGCVGCHAGHQLSPGAQPYLDEGRVSPHCARCHQAMGGPSAPFGAGATPPAGR